MIARVQARYPDVGFMTLKQAEALQDLVCRHELRSILEIGTYKGKGTAFMAAMLEQRGGAGTLTTLDRLSCLKHAPNVYDILNDLQLSHRVRVVIDHRSFTNSLRQLLAESPMPTFDLCYLDAGHVWDTAGFGFLLVNMLLKPGGWIVLDDLNWTIARSPTFSKSPSSFRGYSDEEKATPQVRQVWELLVSRAGYADMKETAFGWGIARKQSAAEQLAGLSSAATSAELKPPEARAEPKSC